MTKSKTKRTSRRLHGVVTGHGYAWRCDFGLCHWAEPSKAALTKTSKPSPEAVPVRVRILSEHDFRKLNAR